ncbi:GGDEF domain-containing protein [Marinomonas sp. M1K-6]|uniref:diguanylate cyclase n=1 Tax=Marinomonas profundi TaxID=2726122 RepID=A0A847R0B1_9GAMM|nr:GGDEF domain-containing protein [Marinomonas profundi]NLQ16931.1 GGDEF domain-containing protein [Marinomonas profundi]UDV02661.1 GGDEF domain-containing protein [Marinomonas profundi]
MFSLTKKTIEKLLNIGFEDEYDNDVNQKHVVNFSYLMFCVSGLLLLIVFFSRNMPYVVFICLVGLWVGVIGLRYSYRGYFLRAQLLMPIAKISQVAILSLFYFGAESGFHLLFLNVIAYAFIVFRADQRFIQYWIVIVSIVLFLVCEFLSPKGLYLTSFDQNLVLVCVFLFTAFYFAVVIRLVMNRLKAVNHHLRQLAERDELTGLSNRRKVLADAVNIFADSVINQESCVFAIVDLDHFKKINDTFGHEAGDLVLTKVATMMASVIRTEDEIGRYGGEEFIVIMPNTNLKEAEATMERMRESVENMLIETEHGIVIPVTVSIGLAPIAPSVSRYEEILAQADKGLYIAKRSGRNRISVQSIYQD